ncbi:hypothetical protein Ndes2526B_g07737 [Nannochloris sp. 'desiccata']|nr:hypothetical protein KSW81_002408 [Chlorella desiccata (nom. nud.)]KAH7617146.1 hypothetical protein NADE_006932 [Chlorella desiccata (nom. nud.)]
MPLLESNKASGTLFQVAFAGLSKPQRPLTADQFVGGSKSEPLARIAEEAADAVQICFLADFKAFPAAKLVTSSSMAAEVPLPNSPTEPGLKDAGIATRLFRRLAKKIKRA